MIGDVVIMDTPALHAMQNITLKAQLDIRTTTFFKKRLWRSIFLSFLQEDYGSNIQVCL
jgi:hypothetical protein